MSPLPPSIISTLSSTSSLVVATSLIAFPTSITPIPSQSSEPAPLSELPIPDATHMSKKVIFDIIVGLALFILTMSACFLVAKRRPVSETIDRMCTTLDTVKQYISSFRLTTFLTRAGNAIAGANSASVSSMRERGGGDNRSIPPDSFSVPLQSVGRGGVATSTFSGSTAYV